MFIYILKYIYMYIFSTNNKYNIQISHPYKESNTVVELLLL